MVLEDASGAGNSWACREGWNSRDFAGGEWMCDTRFERTLILSRILGLKTFSNEARENAVALWERKPWKNRHLDAGSVTRVLHALRRKSEVEGNERE